MTFAAIGGSGSYMITYGDVPEGIDGWTDVVKQYGGKIVKGAAKVAGKAVAKAGLGAAAKKLGVAGKSGGGGGGGGGGEGGGGGGAVAFRAGASPAAFTQPASSKGGMGTGTKIALGAGAVLALVFGLKALKH